MGPPRALPHALHASVGVQILQIILPKGAKKQAFRFQRSLADVDHGFVRQNQLHAFFPFFQAAAFVKGNGVLIEAPHAQVDGMAMGQPRLTLAFVHQHSADPLPLAGGRHAYIVDIEAVEVPEGRILPGTLHQRKGVPHDAAVLLGDPDKFLRVSQQPGKFLLGIKPAFFLKKVRTAFVVQRGNFLLKLPNEQMVSRPGPANDDGHGVSPPKKIDKGKGARPKAHP